ncbi:hypothetical protein DOTSEDRAFT_74422 [Dothistroma septosporum NZE10]|uniref:Uncharacterized protein n=1 Tax=Dothistroma septosporum (strain NZE10 / CBS 128990) TaxID=675120 RepID=N1PER7_DOTSN|nr:hypothetical protein DOTSEDRAFT_74422 [Dothistroma septosporum NZE10]
MDLKNAALLRHIRGQGTEALGKFDKVPADVRSEVNSQRWKASESTEPAWAIKRPPKERVADGRFRAPVLDLRRSDLIMWAEADDDIVYASQSDRHAVASYNTEGQDSLRLIRSKL